MPETDEQALLRILECYILHCIDSLDDKRRAMLEEFSDNLRQAFPQQGDWHEIISAQFGFTEEMTKDINKLWDMHRDEMEPQEFAEAFGERFFKFDGEEECLPPNVTDITPLARRRDAIKALHQNNSHEALNRKNRTEEFLRDTDVCVNEGLPVIEDSSTARLRTAEEIASRAACLLAVAVHAEAFDNEITNSIVSQYDAQEYLTPKERAFIALKEKPKDPEGEQTCREFIWRYEALWVLLWALGYIPELTRPEYFCDVPMSIQVVKKRNLESLLEDARLRTIDEVLDEADLIYRYHWALVDARVCGYEPPDQLNGPVVFERHYALNWLIGYMNQDWDDVSTDT